MTWSVRGIDDEARERALGEARRAGLSVGEWLNSVILDRRQDPSTAAPAGGIGPAAPANPMAVEVERKLAELTERLQRLSATPSAPPRMSAPTATSASPALPALPAQAAPSPMPVAAQAATPAAAAGRPMDDPEALARALARLIGAPKPEEPMRPAVNRPAEVPVVTADPPARAELAPSGGRGSLDGGDRTTGLLKTLENLDARLRTLRAAASSPETAAHRSGETTVALSAAAAPPAGGPEIRIPAAAPEPTARPAATARTEASVRSPVAPPAETGTLLSTRLDLLQSAIAEITARRQTLAAEAGTGSAERPGPQAIAVSAAPPVASAPRPRLPELNLPAAPLTQVLLTPAPPTPAPQPQAPLGAAIPPLAPAAVPSMAEIERHFRALAERIDGLAARRDPVGPTDLLDEIRAFRADMESRGRHPTAADLSMVETIVGRVDALAAARIDPNMLDPLVLEIARLRDTIAQSDPQPGFARLEAGLGHVVARVEDLGRHDVERDAADRAVLTAIATELGALRTRLEALPDAGEVAGLRALVAGVAGQVETFGADAAEARRLAAGLEEIRQALGAFDAGGLVRLFDQRLTEIAEKIAALESRPGPGLAPDRLEALIDELRAIRAGSGTAEALQAIEDQTFEVTRRLAAIEAAARRDDNAVITARIASLAEQLDRLGERTPDATQVAAIQTAIADLVERLDRAEAPRSGDAPQFGAIEALLHRIDEQMAGLRPSHHLDMMEAFEARVTTLVDKLDRLELRPFTGLDPSALAREIAALRTEIARSVAQPSSAAIEARLNELGDRIDRARITVDERAMVLIEEQLGRLNRQIEESESRNSGLGAIEETLTRIQMILSEQQDLTMETARQVAREALSEIAGVTEDRGTLAAVEALRAEMAALQNGMREHEAAAATTLRSVHDALAAVIQRLGAVEGRTATPPAAELLASLQSGLLRAEQSRTVTEDARPLAVGSGKPGLRGRAADPEAASSDRRAGETDETMAAAPRRTDFIAAARRAAQAAQQAETLPVDEPFVEPQPGPQNDGLVPEENPRGPLARIGAALRGRRRPLMLAAAAVLLAVFALQMLPGQRQTETAGTAAKAPQVAELGKPVRDPAGTAVPAVGGTPATGGTPPALVAPSQSGSASLTPPSIPPGGFIDTPRPSIAPGGFATTPTATPEAGVQPVRIAAPPPSLGADPIITGGIQKAPEDQGGSANLEPPEAIGSSALRKAAAAGDVKAQFEVGMRFAEGRGVIADPKEAAIWYQRAADRGFPPAQYRLGSAYEKGHTGTRDPIQARRWYLSAAEKGNVRAMHNLGVLFANDRDMTNAVPWFQKAAEYGLRDSQFNLGIIYALGSGVKQDLAVSYKWFGLAALQGDKDAEKKRDEVAGHLDKSNLAAAKAAVEVFRARAADKTANEEATVWIEPGASQAGLGPADTIQRVQALLQSRGLYGGAITGTLDDKTRQAVRTQQRKLNMKPTGEPDEAFLRALQGNAT